MHVTKTAKSIFLLLALITFGNSCKEKKNPVTQPAPTNSTTAIKETTFSSGLDKSPMDMSYLPVDYPKLKISSNYSEPLIARIIYSRPKKDGRIIFGNLVKYGSRWRLGANEATEIEFFRDVTMAGKKINKDRYIIYCIPYQDKWRIILNKDLFTWGLKIDSTKDVNAFDASIFKTNYPFEFFTMQFEQSNNGTHLTMAWDSVKAVVPITY